MQFIDEIDNAIVKAQIENKEKREVRIETTKAKGTKGRKKSANSK